MDMGSDTPQKLHCLAKHLLDDARLCTPENSARFRAKAPTKGERDVVTIRIRRQQCPVLTTMAGKPRGAHSASPNTGAGTSPHRSGGTHCSITNLAGRKSAGYAGSLSAASRTACGRSVVSLKSTTGNAPLAQLAEALHSNRRCSGFESLRGHHADVAETE